MKCLIAAGVVLLQVRFDCLTLTLVQVKRQTLPDHRGVCKSPENKGKEDDRVLVTPPDPASDGET
jgi:hypothetical protein